MNSDNWVIPPNKSPTGKHSNFFLGQIVQHKLLGYRGVIIDVDPEFMLDDAWYDSMAKSHPPREKPWFKVLVHNTGYETYVAEQNLVADSDPEQVNHPEIRHYFSRFHNGHYTVVNKIN